MRSIERNLEIPMGMHLRSGLRTIPEMTASRLMETKSIIRLIQSPDRGRIRSEADLQDGLQVQLLKDRVRIALAVRFFYCYFRRGLGAGG